MDGALSTGSETSALEKEIGRLTFTFTFLKLLRPGTSAGSSCWCFCRSSTITASLGDYDVTVAEGTEQHIDTDLTILHSPYRSPLHSLAMVRLAKPARFSRYVQPIALPSSCPQPGESCRVSGWGSTIPNQGK